MYQTTENHNENQDLNQLDIIREQLLEKIEHLKYLMASYRHELTRLDSISENISGEIEINKMRRADLMRREVSSPLGTYEMASFKQQRIDLSARMLNLIARKKNILLDQEELYKKMMNNQNSLVELYKKLMENSASWLNLRNKQTQTK